MAWPQAMVDHGERDLRLAIKSSFPHIKSALALVCLLWDCNERPASLAYSKSAGDSVQIDDGCFLAMKRDLQPIYGDNTTDAEFLEAINNNQLFKSQMESLQVAFELIWRLALVKFVDNRPFNAERTGRSRYPKLLHFTKNMDYIGLLMDTDIISYRTVLLNWACNYHFTVNQASESRLIKAFTIISEEAVYRVRRAPPAI